MGGLAHVLGALALVAATLGFALGPRLTLTAAVRLVVSASADPRDVARRVSTPWSNETARLARHEASRVQAARASSFTAVIDRPLSGTRG